MAQKLTAQQSEVSMSYVPTQLQMVKCSICGICDGSIDDWASCGMQICQMSLWEKLGK